MLAKVRLSSLLLAFTMFGASPLAMAGTGGGYTAAGIYGEYFNGSSMSCSPLFTRQDTRINFDWGIGSPGGSISPGFRDIGSDHFSVRWTGQIVPAFSETYTFTTTSDDGVRLLIKPAGTTSWTVLVNNWSQHAPKADSGSIDLTKGNTYDVRLDYFEASGGARIKLAWSSASTPSEIIEPLSLTGINGQDVATFMYADAMRTSRPEWGDPNDYFNKPKITTDSHGWPLGDGVKIVWEGRDAAAMAGVYLVQFTGKADVYAGLRNAQFSVDRTTFVDKLSSGDGYDAGTNTTTVYANVVPTGIFWLNLVNSQRTPGSPVNSGVTNVKMMRPTTRGSSFPYCPDVLFADEAKRAFSHYIGIRWGYYSIFDVSQVQWADRTIPGTGDCWEYYVMLANETGKDLYVCLPVNVSQDYVKKLAMLIRYGSDGVNPYSSPRANPVYPGLNSNLCVYIEGADEVWNWVFPSAQANNANAQAAVKNNTPDGQIINFDGACPNGDFRRWAALQAVQRSKIFRSVFGDAAMGSTVRMLYEYQYLNYQFTATEGLSFIDKYFNNADGKHHVDDPHPVSYYLWGAGGAAYYGCNNELGSQADIVFGDPDFEAVPVDAGKASVAPQGTAWTFAGNAGVFHKPESGVAPIDGIGTPPSVTSGVQSAFVAGTGSISQSINFTKTGTFALQFLSALPSSNWNYLRVLVDDSDATPLGSGDYRVFGVSWAPNLGTWGVSATDFSPATSAPFQITTTGQHTIKVVGVGGDNSVAYMDNFAIVSLDAMYAAGIPSSSLIKDAGKTPQENYRAQLAQQASYAKAYGLNVVVYEGGWALGGDFGSSTLMNYGKFVDLRTVQCQMDALDSFAATGGSVFFVSYPQWPVYDMAGATTYPLVKAVDQVGARLRP